MYMSQDPLLTRFRIHTPTPTHTHTYIYIHTQTHIVCVCVCVCVWVDGWVCVWVYVKKTLIRSTLSHHKIRELCILPNSIVGILSLLLPP